MSTAISGPDSDLWLAAVRKPSMGRRFPDWLRPQLLKWVRMRAENGLRVSSTIPCSACGAERRFFVGNLGLTAGFGLVIPIPRTFDRGLSKPEKVIFDQYAPIRRFVTLFY